VFRLDHFTRQGFSDTQGMRVNIYKRKVSFHAETNQIGDESAGEYGASCANENNFLVHLNTYKVAWSTIQHCRKLLATKMGIT
jgi:hypothetical protein